MILKFKLLTGFMESDPSLLFELKKNKRTQTTAIQEKMKLKRSKKIFTQRFIKWKKQIIK